MNNYQSEHNLWRNNKALLSVENNQAWVTTPRFKPYLAVCRRISSKTIADFWKTRFQGVWWFTFPKAASLVNVGKKHPTSNLTRFHFLIFYRDNAVACCSYCVFSVVRHVDCFIPDFVESLGLVNWHYGFCSWPRHVRLVKPSFFLVPLQSSAPQRGVACKMNTLNFTALKELYMEWSEISWHGRLGLLLCRFCGVKHDIV